MRYFAKNLDAPTGRGEEIWKCISLRVFNIGNTGSTFRRMQAGPGKGYTASAIENFLESVADDLEKRFPDHDFRLVALGDAKFNFVWERKRPSAASQQPAAG